MKMLRTKVLAAVVLGLATANSASSFAPKPSTTSVPRGPSSPTSTHSSESSFCFSHQTSSRRRCRCGSTRSEDIYAAVHRKEYEMKQVKAAHTSTTDPVRMAMSYAQESLSSMRLARALRRVHEDARKNPDHPDYVEPSTAQKERNQKLKEIGMADLGMRKASFIADVKRFSRLGQHPREMYCYFDDAGQVAAAMVQLGADAVFINTDYPAYGGDLTELKSAVQAVRAVSKTAAVVMKDIVVDEIQLGLAKEAGADGILLMSSVLGPALENFLDLATTIGLEVIVECHTKAEVERALDLTATNILVNNYDRVRQELHPEQAIKLAGLFPGSGGPIICLATGGLENGPQIKRHLAVGYDGVVVGRAILGSTTAAPELIRTVRDRTLLPAELSGWGLEDAEFDMDGNYIEPRRANPPPDAMDDSSLLGDPTAFQ